MKCHKMNIEIINNILEVKYKYFTSKSKERKTNGKE